MKQWTMIWDHQHFFIFFLAFTTQISSSSDLVPPSLTLDIPLAVIRSSSSDLAPPSLKHWHLQQWSGHQAVIWHLPHWLIGVPLAVIRSSSNDQVVRQWSGSSLTDPRHPHSSDLVLWQWSGTSLTDPGHSLGSVRESQIIAGGRSVLGQITARDARLLSYPADHRHCFIYYLGV